MALKTEAMGPSSVAVVIPLSLRYPARLTVNRPGRPRTASSRLLQALFGRKLIGHPFPYWRRRLRRFVSGWRFEASRIAVITMVPVIILQTATTLQTARSRGGFRIGEIPDFPVKFASDPKGFLPYKRDPPERWRGPLSDPETPGLVDIASAATSRSRPHSNINS